MTIQPDKVKHIIAGFAIGLLLPFSIEWIFAFPLSFNLALSAILLAMISYGFELFSLITGRGHYDIMDAVATVAGGVPALGIAAMLL
ncbi:MAG: hypothetical protein QM687_02995 [Ferruginibacter sp.]